MHTRSYQPTELALTRSWRAEVVGGSVRTGHGIRNGRASGQERLLFRRAFSVALSPLDKLTTIAPY